MQNYKPKNIMYNQIIKLLNKEYQIINKSVKYYEEVKELVDIEREI